MKKFQGLHRYLLDQHIITESEVIEPSMVDFVHLFTAHTQRYAKAVWDGALDRKEIRRMGLPWSKSLAIRSRLAVQGTINASIIALQDGMAGNLAGGTHHAMPDHGEGFCVYNDVAVAIKMLKQTKWINNAMVIDCDVHQGNGTAEIFKDDDTVFTYSIHGEKNYPFVKPPSTMDVGLEDGTTDELYIRSLIQSLDQAYNQFKPDLVYYLGGIDILETDHFGRLSMTLAGLRERDRVVIELAHQNGIPLVLLLSGGYAPSLNETVVAHSQMFEIAKELGF